MVNLRSILKKIIPLIAVACLLPSTVLALVYTMAITVVNTTATNYDMLGVIVGTSTSNSNNNTWLAQNFYISPSGLDTRIMSGNTSLPHMLAEDRTCLATEIDGMQTLNLEYKTGQTPLSDFYIIPGYDGYITATDNESLELGYNFEFSMSGYVDADTGGVDRNLVYKEGALHIYISAANTITCNMTTGSGNATLTSAITTGEHTIGLTCDSTNLLLVIDGTTEDSQVMASGSISVNATSGYSLFYHSDLVYAVAQGAAVGSESFNTGAVGQNKSGATYYVRRAVHQFDTSAIPDTSTVVSANVSYYVTNLNNTNAFYWVIVDANGVSTPIGGGGGGIYGEILSFTTNLGQLHSSGMTGGSTWNTVNLNTTGLSTCNKTGNTFLASRTNLDISATSPTVNEFFEFENNVAGTHKPKLEVSYADPMVDNGNDWLFMQNNSMPYCDNISITVNGVDVLEYDPITILNRIDDATATLPDREGAAQDGIITWGANPLGVTATIGSLTAPPAPGGVGASSLDNEGIDILPIVNPELNGSSSAPSNAFSPLFEMWADFWDVPDNVGWIVIAMLVVIGSFIAVYHFFGHLGAALSISCLFLGLFSLPTVAVLPQAGLIVGFLGLVAGVVVEAKA